MFTASLSKRSLLRFVRGCLAILTIFTSFSPKIIADNPPDVYKILAAVKSASSSPNLALIDDFNSGKLEERGGATWRVKSPVPGALDLGIDKQDGRSQDRGHSLKVFFNMQPAEVATFETFLNDMDVSSADYFVFRFKTELQTPGDFYEKMYLTLYDWRHRKITKDITEYLPKEAKNWTDVAVPIGDFAEQIDLDQVGRLRLGIEAVDSAAKGVLWIDDMGFFSFKDIAFESQQDNLVVFPTTKFDTKKRQKLLKEKNDKKLLKEIARDTWKFFVEAKDKDTHLVTDHIRVGESPVIANYTSPTNIAMDFLAIITAKELSFISRDEALTRVKNILATLKGMPKYKGFFYNFYDIKKLSIARKYISSVDSGWLAVSLVVLRQAFPEVAEEINGYLDGFDFGEFLDPENNQLVVGIELPMEKFGEYHYGMLVTEARATSFYAIGKGDIPRDHWWFLYRTLPEVWKWQKQVPKGGYVTQEGIEYFQGYYEKNGKKFVPSWGGSLFEVLMPTLVLRENELAPNGLGFNNKITTELHRDYALKEKGYAVWGISPCSMASGRNSVYREYGVPELGSKGYPDREVITPHVSFLALDSLPQDAIANIRKLLEFEIYGEYGFYDSLYLRNNRVTTQYLSLDQGMILAAIGNYLTDGAIQKLFHSDTIAKQAEGLLTEENFFRTNYIVAPVV